jgi:hypothetical protein
MVKWGVGVKNCSRKNSGGTVGVRWCRFLKTGKSVNVKSGAENSF